MICDVCEGQGGYRESWYENRHRCNTCDGTGKLGPAHIQKKISTKETLLADLKRQVLKLETELDQLRKTT